MIKALTLAAQMEHNRELADIFLQMADCYRYLGTEHRFRVNAYDHAAKTLLQLDQPVDVYSDDIKKLDALPGIGESIAEKIIEYLNKGSIASFEKLKQEVPYQLFSLLHAEGVGPALLRSLHEQAGIDNMEQLAAAVSNGSLAALAGLGERKLHLLRKVLKLPEAKARMSLKTAQRIGEHFLDSVQGIIGVRRSMLAGSVRRRQETIGDIDIVLTAPHIFWKRIMQRITKLPEVSKVLVSGPTRTSVLLKEHAIQVDVRVVHDDEWGAALLYFTGSKQHNIQLRSMAHKRGWKINEYGLFDKSGKKLAGETEAGMYEQLGLKFIPPEKRKGLNEIEEAMH